LLSALAGEAAQNTPPKTAETGGKGAKPSTAGAKPRGAKRERRVIRRGNEVITLYRRSTGRAEAGQR